MSDRSVTEEVVRPDKAPTSLGDAVEHMLGEARMVLPGLQALFGFQLVVVFNDRFEVLSDAEQCGHLAALILVGLAGALLMAPTAYHRQTHKAHVSRVLLDTASRLICIALIPLAAGMCIDIYLVARMITGSLVVSGVAAGALFLVITILWFVWPRWRRLHQPD